MAGVDTISRGGGDSICGFEGSIISFGSFFETRTGQNFFLDHSFPIFLNSCGVVMREFWLEVKPALLQSDFRPLGRGIDRILKLRHY